MAVLVGTENGLYELDRRPRVLVEGHAITHLVRGSDGWWALIDGATIWHARDGEWKQVGTIDGPRATCLFPWTAGLLLGTVGAHLLRFQGRTVEQVVSFETVQGRQQWYTPWGGPPDTRSIAEDATGTTYVNVHVGGIVRSSNGGRTWEPTIDIETDVHQVLSTSAQPGWVFAASAQGLASSVDRGTSWKLRTDGLHATYQRAVAVCEDIVLVSASSGPRGQRAALYRAPFKEEKPFERCRGGLPDWFSGNIDTFCLAASGQRAGFGTSDGHVFISTDQGRSWELAASNLAPVRCLAMG